MITAWRIVEARFAETAFDGEGARRTNGRWHSRGTAIVYTSSSDALATLEMLVHLERRIPRYVIIACSFHEVLVEEITRASLPTHWKDFPSPPQLRELGDAWARDRVSAVLSVPSALSDTEHNYLLNPEHDDFRSIEIASPRPFRLDPRNNSIVVNDNVSLYPSKR